MATVYDTMFYPKSYLSILNQRRLTTNTRYSPDELNAIYGADISSRRATALKEQELAIQQQRNADEAAYRRGVLESTDKQLRAQKQSGIISGIVSLPAYGTSIYNMGKEVGLWGTKTPATTDKTFTGAGSLKPDPSTFTGSDATTLATTQSGPPTAPVDYGMGYTATPGSSVAEGTMPGPGEMYANPTNASYYETLNASEGIPTFSAASGSTAATDASVYASTYGTGIDVAGSGPGWGAAAPSAGVGSYIPVVGAGYVGGKLGEIGGNWAGEQLGIGGERERSIGGGVIGGAAAGAAMGSIVPVVGTAVGAVIGGIVGGVSAAFGGDGGCIIVTACHGKDSKEVEIARKFRDKFMSPEEIRGYYVMAEKIAPVMRICKPIRDSIKTGLVDSLIEYGKFKLEITDKCSAKAVEISLRFIKNCGDIGKKIPKYIRTTGEEV